MGEYVMMGAESKDLRIFSFAMLQQGVLTITIAPDI
jgi:hypothetical protein